MSFPNVWKDMNHDMNSLNSYKSLEILKLNLEKNHSMRGKKIFEQKTEDKVLFSSNNLPFNFIHPLRTNWCWSSQKMFPQQVWIQAFWIKNEMECYQDKWPHTRRHPFQQSFVIISSSPLMHIRGRSVVRQFVDLQAVQLEALPR